MHRAEGRAKLVATVAKVSAIGLMSSATVTSMLTHFWTMIIPRRRPDIEDRRPLRSQRRLQRVAAGTAESRAMQPAQNRAGSVSTYSGEVPLVSRAVRSTHKRMRGDRLTP